LPPIMDFVGRVFEGCPMPAAVPVFALLYLLRLKQRLPPNAQGAVDTPHRLLLASLLISSKYLCEVGTHLTSAMIARNVAPWYDAQDINRMERSLLQMLGFDLWVSPLELNQFIARYGHSLQLRL
ncbi:hypothetical protein DM01DRAFT_247123, partial [Hesseltinella vesiculosa]